MATDEQILANTTELLANLQEKCWKGYEKKRNEENVRENVPELCQKVQEKEAQEA